MRTIANRIYRERRRLGLVVILAAIAGYLFYMHVPHEVGGVPVAWVTAALYGVFVGVSTLLVCLVLPGFRFAMEAFAVSRLIYASAVAVYPALGAVTVQEPFLNATIVVLGGFAISLAFYSDWFGRQFPLSGAVATVRTRGPVDPRAALTLPEDALRRLSYTPDGAAARGTLYALVTDPEPDIRLDHDAETGTARLRIRHKALPWRTAFAAWIDDAYGRVLDANTEQAAASAPEPALEPETVAA